MVMLGGNIWAELWRWGGSHGEIWGENFRHRNTSIKVPRAQKTSWSLSNGMKNTCEGESDRRCDQTVGWKHLIKALMCHGKEFRFYYCIKWRKFYLSSFICYCVVCKRSTVEMEHNTSGKLPSYLREKWLNSDPVRTVMQSRSKVLQLCPLATSPHMCLCLPASSVHMHSSTKLASCCSWQAVHINSLPGGFVSKHPNRTHAPWSLPSSHGNVEKVSLTSNLQLSCQPKPWHSHFSPDSF